MSTAPPRKPAARPVTGRPVAGRPVAGRPVAVAGPRLAAKKAAERRDRRATQLRRTAWVAAAVGPLALLGWLVLGSSLLAVRTVAVTGVHRLSVAQVLAAADVPPGRPLARLDTGSVARRVGSLDPVLHVTVTRAWPHGLRVSVIERIPVVAVPRGGQLELLDGSGHDVARVRTSGLLDLAVAHPSPTDPSTRAALTVLRALPSAVRRQVRSLAAPSPEQVELVLSGRRRVVWGGVSGSTAKVAELVVLLRLPGHIYDVSAPGVVTRR